MADLIETTLSQGVSASASLFPLTSTSGIVKGDYLYVDGETVIVTASPSGRCVRVMRGAAGAAGVPHRAGSACFIGASHLFYTADPAGRCPAAPDANPWVNTIGRRVWRAQGDAHGPGSADRVWVLVEPSYPVGALGIRTAPTAAP